MTKRFGSLAIGSQWPGQARLRSGVATWSLVLGACASGNIQTGEPSTPLTPMNPLVASASIGSLAGAFAVANDGAATYTIPLVAPKGRAGLEPSLSLAYSSRGGNGLAGVGWSLSGLSSIARCPRMFFRDGEVRPIQFGRFGTNDNFCLDGARLVKIADTANVADCTRSGQVEYRTEPDSFARIIACGSDAFGPIEWIVYTKDSQIRRYGGDSVNARLDVSTFVPDQDGNAVGAYTIRRPVWALVRAQDHAGNYMTYSYDRSAISIPDKLEWWPTRIDYTGFGAGPCTSQTTCPDRSVVFEYASRSDAASTYLSGIELAHTQLLFRVTMNAPNAPEQSPLLPYVRRYLLFYTTSATSARSLLTGATECDGFGVCKPLSVFTYSTQSPTFVGTNQGSAPGYGETTLFGTDVNGDGKDDLLYNNRDTATNTFNNELVQLAGGTLASPSFGPPTLTHATSLQPATRIPYDVNQDGTVELFSDYCSHKSCLETDPDTGACTGRLACDEVTATVAYADGTGHFGDTLVSSKLCTGGFHCGSHNLRAVADLNGDLGPDLIAGSGYETDLVLGFHPAFRLVNPITRPNWLVGHPRYQDIDGDGAVDVLIPHPLGSANRYDALHLRGSAGAPRVEATPLGYDFKPNNCQLFADVNGDGLADIVDLQNNATVILNRGDGRFVSSGNWAPGFTGTPICAQYQELGLEWLGWKQTAVFPIDYNHDGLQDLLILQPVSSTSESARVLVSTGSGFTVKTIASVPLVCGATDSVTSATTLDANGDGLVDIVFMCTSSQPSAAYFELYTQVASATAAGRSDILTDVRDGLGAIVRHVDYKPTIDPTVYAPAGIRYSLPAVVASESIDNGAGGLVEVARHTYEGGGIGSGGEGWLGFHSHTILDPRTNARRRLTFATNTASAGTFLNGRAFHPFTGQLIEDISSVTATGTTVLANRTRVTPRVIAETYPGGVANYFTIASAVTSESFETAIGSFSPDAPGVPLTTTQTSTTTNLCGDPTTVVVDRAPGASVITRTTTVRTFPNVDPAATACSLGATWLDLLTLETTYSQRGGGTNARTLQYIFESDGTGRVRDTILQPGGPPNQQRTTHVATRDAFGNPTQIDTTAYIPAAGGVPARWETRTARAGYDARGIFVVSTTNALGHTTTSKVHPGLGVTYRVTEPSLLVTANQYDGFGRLVRTIAPDGHSSQIAYLAPGSAPACSTDGYTAASFAFAVDATGSDGHRALTCTDRLARRSRVATLQASGTLSYVDTRFSPSFPDRIDQVTRPHFAGAIGYIAAKNIYDPAGRVIVACHAPPVPSSASDFSSCASTNYTGLQTDTCDENHVRKRSLMSSTGGLASTSIFPDATSCFNGTEAITSFEYGPFDTVMRIRDASGNFVMQDFDELSRRWRLVDADVGTITTQYSGFDQVVSETQQDGTTTTLAYDALGRMISRTAPDGVDSFTYVPSGAGIGKLASQQRVTTSPASTVQQTYAYGPTFGHLQTETWTIDGASYAFDYTYDAEGRLSTTAYPSVANIGRVQTIHRYGVSGHLTEIDPINAPAQSPAYLWKLITTDAEGNVLDEQLAPADASTQGIHRRRTYFDGNGLVKSIDVQDTYGASVAKQTYVYDFNGNLHARTDALQNKTETFGYDSASRLVSVTGPTNVAYTYDAIGNLTSSTEPGLQTCTIRHGEPMRGSPAFDPRQLGPHAPTSVYCANNNYTSILRYDARGNQSESNAGAALQNTAYSSFNKPASLDGWNGPHEVFEYDASHQRVKKIVSGSTTVPSVTYVGGRFEQRQIAGSAAVDYVFIVPGVGQLIVRFDAGATTGNPIPYLVHTDLLGSPMATTDLRGAVQERMSFDAFGRRRNTDWTYPANFVGPAPANTKIGYTGHSNDDELPAVDMGGRIYDPILKRFYQPDPFIQSPSDGLSWNRYSYVFNNPLTHTDPTGYESASLMRFFAGGTQLDASATLFEQSQWGWYALPGNAYSRGAILTPAGKVVFSAIGPWVDAAAAAYSANLQWATYLAQWYATESRGARESAVAALYRVNADGRNGGDVEFATDAPRPPPTIVKWFRDILAAIMIGRGQPINPVTGARKPTITEKVEAQTRLEEKATGQAEGIPEPEVESPSAASRASRAGRVGRVLGVLGNLFWAFSDVLHMSRGDVWVPSNPALPFFGQWRTKEEATKARPMTDEEFERCVQRGGCA